MEQLGALGALHRVGVGAGRHGRLLAAAGVGGIVVQRLVDDRPRLEAEIRLVVRTLGTIYLFRKQNKNVLF